MGDIGTERREVEFEPLPEEAGPAPRPEAPVDPGPAMPARPGVLPFHR